MMDARVKPAHDAGKSAGWAKALSAPCPPSFERLRAEWWARHLTRHSRPIASRVELGTIVILRCSPRDARASRASASLEGWATRAGGYPSRRRASGAAPQDDG